MIRHTLGPSVLMAPTARVFPLVILLLLGASAPARPHDFWLSGKQVDPATKLLCCGENDCHLLPVSAAHPRAAGYHLDDTNEDIAWARVQPSPDGGFGPAAGAVPRNASSRRYREPERC